MKQFSRDSFLETAYNEVIEWGKTLTDEDECEAFERGCLAMGKPSDNDAWRSFLVMARSFVFNHGVSELKYERCSDLYDSIFHAAIAVGNLSEVYEENGMLASDLISECYFERVS